MRLAWAGPNDGSTWLFDMLADVPVATRQAEAARAVIDMAEAGDGEGLRRLLRPDPACTVTSWTVACYRIGDLVPHSLRDFTDPVSAVTALVDCGDADHLAAELVASTPAGLCWVALVRTGGQVRFQLFDEHSVLGRPGRRVFSDAERAAVGSAKARWAAVLASWYTHQGSRGLAAKAGVGGLGNEELRPAAAPSAGGPSAGGPSGAPSGGPPSGAAPSGSPQPRDGDVLAAVVATLNELADVVTGIAAAVERLESSVGALSSRFDAVVPSPPPAGGPGPGLRTPTHRANRRRPAVGGATAEPL